MTEKQFEVIVNERLEKIKEVFLIKGKEYWKNKNPFHNFESGARVENTTRERVLHGFLLKHYVSYMDLLDSLDNGELPTEEYVDEKIGDLINYLILQEAQIKERIKNDVSRAIEIAEQSRNLSWTYAPNSYKE